MFGQTGNDARLDFNHGVLQDMGFSLVNLTGTIGVGIKTRENIIPVVEVTQLIGLTGGTPFDTYAVGVRFGCIFKVGGKKTDNNNSI